MEVLILGDEWIQKEEKHRDLIPKKGKLDQRLRQEYGEAPLRRGLCRGG